MPLIKITFTPGVITDATRYAAEGGWVDADKVRFRLGYPEKIGGWQSYTSNLFAGTARSLHQWNDLLGNRYMGVGTSLKFYIEYSGQVYDITAIRRTANLGNNPFISTANGAITMKVTDNGHAAQSGDFVTFLAAVGNGQITAGQLNTEFQIISLVDANNYIVSTPVTFSGTPTAFGGNAPVVAKYNVSSGLDITASGTGWGVGAYSRGTWGSAASQNGATLRVWSQDNFGEDLIMVPSYGPPCVWQATNGLATRALLLSAVPGATDVPNLAILSLVTDDRHVVLYGTNDYGSSVFDPMMVRWSNQQDYANWTVSTLTTAGSQRLNSGSQIVAAKKTKGETLIWTDKAIFSQQFVGPPYIFGFNMITDSVSIVSQNAAVLAHNSMYWMDQRNFYVYNGSVSPIPCPMISFIFDNLSPNQLAKVFGGLNSEYNEIWWFYPGPGSAECDHYVTYNFVTNEWSKGTLARTAWADLSLGGRPVAAATNGYLYQHEVGCDDITANVASGVDAYIESADFDLGDGDQFQHVSRILPDVTFLNATSVGNVDVTIKARDFPGDSLVSRASGTVTPTVEQIHTRVRGRQATLRFESDTIGCQWRLGATRLDIRTDGRR